MKIDDLTIKSIQRENVVSGILIIAGVFLGFVLGVCFGSNFCRAHGDPSPWETVPGQHPTIQDAIEGGHKKINLLPGRYSGEGFTRLIIREDVRIRCDYSNTDPAIIDMQDESFGWLYVRTAGMIQNITFTNAAESALILWDSSPEIYGSVFTGNSSESGGGICSLYGDPKISRCTFTRNSAKYYGGAISLYDSAAEIQDCQFSMNISGRGGAIYGFQYYGTVLNCTAITMNFAWFGGGIYLEDSRDAWIQDSLIVMNGAVCGGGGVCIINSIDTGLDDSEVCMCYSEAICGGIGANCDYYFWGSTEWGNKPRQGSQAEWCQRFPWMCM